MVGVGLAACGPDIPPRSPAPEREPAGDDTHARLEAELSRVRAAMRELCGKRCGSVVLIADSTVRAAQTRPSTPGYGSLIAYNPKARDCARARDASLRFYCMAHEYGHHLDVTMNPSWSADAWTQELRADALAGCAFARAGVATDAAENDFVRAVLLDTPEGRTRADACGSDATHPSLRFSWDALQRGARLCRDHTPTLPELAEEISPLVLSAKASSKNALHQETTRACAPDL